MDSFITQYEKHIIGHLTGFDRLVLRGTLRALAVKNGMMNYRVLSASVHELRLRF